MAAGDFALTVPQMRQAVQLYADGLSRRQIAARFDVSEMAVRSALRLAGVKFRPQSQATIAANVSRTGRKYRTASHLEAA